MTRATGNIQKYENPNVLQRWAIQRFLQRVLALVRPHEVDRILEKVHNKGIQSLTMKEKRILRQATRAEQTRNKF